MSGQQAPGRRDIYLTDARYLAALERNRERIAAGLPFAKHDSEVTGDKWTEATWGLCSDSADLWPEAEDRMWPEQPVRAGHLEPDVNGRVTPKYRHDHQVCPMQTGGVSGGCFYRCLIFKRQLRSRDRDRALARYDSAIERARAALSKASGAAS